MQLFIDYYITILSARTRVFCSFFVCVLFWGRRSVLYCFCFKFVCTVSGVVDLFVFLIAVV